MSGNGDTVVAPLGESKDLSALLITEQALGQTLDYYIAKAIYEQGRDELFEKLGYLARFLVKLHQNSENERTVSSDLPGAYLDKLLNFLSEQTLDALLLGAHWTLELCDQLPLAEESVRFTSLIW